MAGRVMRFLSGWGAFVVAAVWLAWLAVVSLWPGSWWFDVRRVVVFDAPAGVEILMEVDRVIHREFIADWSAVVRRWEDGGWTVACAGRGKSNYRPDAVLPDPLTLSWWTDGACPTLPTGRYFVSTIWTIRGGGLPDKVVQVASNVFTVEEAE